MATLQELLAQQAELEEQIKSLTQGKRQEAIEQIRALMNDNNLTAADIGSLSASKPAAKGKPADGSKDKKETIKVAAKYRDQAGNAWSGRGLQPKWLKAAIESGKKIEDFAV